MINFNLIMTLIKHFNSSTGMPFQKYNTLAEWKGYQGEIVIVNEKLHIVHFSKAISDRCKREFGGRRARVTGGAPWLRAQEASEGRRDGGLEAGAACPVFAGCQPDNGPFSPGVSQPVRRQEEG